MHEDTKRLDFSEWARIAKSKRVCYVVRRMVRALPCALKIPYIEKVIFIVLAE